SRSDRPPIGEDRTMTRRLAAPTLAVAAALLCPGPARPQDHVLARESLDWLRDALVTKQVTLKKLTLASEILNNKLAALFVPALHPPPAYVRKCFRGTTALVQED